MITGEWTINLASRRNSVVGNDPGVIKNDNGACVIHHLTWDPFRGHFVKARLRSLINYHFIKQFTDIRSVRQCTRRMWD